MTVPIKDDQFLFAQCIGQFLLSSSNRFLLFKRFFSGAERRGLVFYPNYTWDGAQSCDDNIVLVYEKWEVKAGRSWCGLKERQKAN